MAAGPLPCELERLTGPGAAIGGTGWGKAERDGEEAPERACVVVRGRDVMPVLRCVGVRWCVCECECGCVGVRKSAGRLWRAAVGVAIMLLLLVVVTGG